MTGSAVNPEFTSQVASTASNESINSFYKTWQAGDLRLRPAFQRNLVWNLEQQSFLVDSILRGLPVPEIYVQKETSAEGEEKTIVVDGQQRISTCIRFIKGDLRLVSDEDLDIRWKGKVFTELEEPLRKRFRSFELIVRRLPDVGEAVLREVFRRLNKTVEPLEPQELRHAAYTGPYVKLIEQAAKRSLFGEVGLFSAKDYLRRRNDEFIAEIGMAVSFGAYPNKKEGLDELFLTYERQGVPGGVIENLERRFGRVFDELSAIAGQLRRTRFRNKSDFYTLFVYLAKNAELLPVADIDRSDLLWAIKGFSDRVNEIKRVEGEGESIDSLISDALGAEAVKYLRAVERAASDRLSRVRREEALAVVLGPEMDKSVRVPLAAADAKWREDLDGEGGEAEELIPSAAEKERAQEVLLSSHGDETELL